MHYNNIYDFVKTKNLILELNAKVFSTNHIAGLLNFNTYGRNNDNFFYAGTYLLKLEFDDKILNGCDQACPGIPKEAIGTLKSQKLKEV